MGKKLFYVILFFPALCFSAIRDWPQEAQDYLKTIPNQNITLDFVVARALSSADSFEIHTYEALRAESTYYSAVAFEDLKLRASYNYFDNRNEPLVPEFMSNSSIGWEAKVGAEQFFSTGTAVTVEGMHRPQAIGFLNRPSFDAIETKVTLGIQQNLLGDFFGSSYRGLKRSARDMRESLLFGAMAKVEGTTLDLITLYYQAWLKKELSLNWLEAKKRKDKLVKILRSQQKRGVVETSDVLQVEGAALQADLEYTTTQRDLQNIWEQLVVNLKLPRSFLQVNAEEIPFALDAPEEKAAELCQKIKFVDLEKNSNQIRELDEQVSAAREKYLAQKEKLLPDLKLVGSYASNSVEADSSLTGAQAQGHKTFREVGDLDNPAWSAGVQLSFPIQNRAQKAQYLMARADYEQSRLKKSILLSDLENKWSQSCVLLKQNREARDKYREISKKNKRRVELDDHRFEVGRIKAFQWVQTEDDEAQSSLKYKQAEVQVRQVAWDIQRQTGHMSDLIKNYLPKKAEINE
jgi:outer membrane protein TolC